MKFSEILDKNINDGLEGKNKGIPFLIPGMDEALAGNRRATYTLLGANTGVGKTAFVDQAYVITPILLHKLGYTKFKVDVDYYSLEISLNRKIAKWASLLLFYLKGKLVPYKDILSFNTKLDKDTLNEIYEIYDILDGAEEYVRIRNKPENPTGIYMNTKSLMKERGTYETITQTVNGVSYDKKIFIPNDPNLIHINIVDHIGKLRREREKQVLLNKKESIDKFSAESCDLRDIEGTSTIAISQFNRDLADINRQRFKELVPGLEDFKETGNPAEDADNVIALFSPARYNIEMYKGYPTRKIGRRTRFAFFLKCRDGEEGVFVPLRFLGEVGHFQKLEDVEYFIEKENIKEFSENYKIYLNPLGKLDYKLLKE